MHATDYGSGSDGEQAKGFLLEWRDFGEHVERGVGCCLPLSAHGIAGQGCQLRKQSPEALQRVAGGGFPGSGFGQSGF